MTWPSNFATQHQEALNRMIQLGLEEDLGTGDHSGRSCIPEHQVSKAVLKIKFSGVLAGIEMASTIFQAYDPDLKVTLIAADGDRVSVGDKGFYVEGKTQAILATERLVLNCLQRMSGIATYTRKLVDAVAHTSCQLLDTRKTTPNFRVAEKWAVTIGGGVNHRMGLYDELMIKDNHIDYCGGVQQALTQTLNYLQNNRLEDLGVVVETRNLKEVEQALTFPWIKRILLDNMSVLQLQEAVQLIDNRIPTEASGNITDQNLVEIAETGVHYISMGALTYAAPICDLSLKAV